MNDFFDKQLLKKFKEGDLVSWKEFGSVHKCYGVVVDLPLKKMDNDRVFAMATVIMINGDEKEFNLGMLNLESKSSHAE